MKNKSFFAFCTVVLLLVLALPLQAQNEKKIIVDPYPVASMMVGTYGIDWLPKVSAEGINLTVSGPGYFYWSQVFPKGMRPRFAVADIKGQCLDGQYKYELTALPQTQPLARGENDFSLSPVYQPAVTQSGSFRIQGGAFLSMTLSETPGKVLDALHYDDVIITGSLCVGFDCIDGESFGYCTEKLKENNLQLCFEDTSIRHFSHQRLEDPDQR